ncbi:MAG: hypothetical protein KJ732_04585, partial [Candidatus Margulisbacteria bacterium]|nr:hypothetical protein [Candidatus Margulisiibacteriota bacterium]
MSVPAFASIFDWQTYETDNFIVFYPRGYEWQAKATLYYFEQDLPRIQKLTGNQEKLKTRIVVQDTGNYSNAFADFINNKILIYTNPSYVFFELQPSNWLRGVGYHESIHINQTFNNSGSGKFATTIFGNRFSANVQIPFWMAEGITVYGESQIDQYEGRLNQGHFSAIVASKAVADNLPSISQANYAYARYPMGYFYVYGGVFFDYLAKTYGEEQFAKFFKLYGSYFWGRYLGALFPALALDRAAVEVYGKTFPELFTDWAAYEKQRWADWQISGERIGLVEELCQASFLTKYDNKLYYYKQKQQANSAFNYHSVYSLVEYDPVARQEKILDQFLTYPLNYPVKAGDKLYYLHKDLADGYANLGMAGRGVIGVLSAYDLKTGKTSAILSDELVDFVIQKTGRIVYVKLRKSSYGSEIWEYDEKTGRKKLGELDEFIGQIYPYKDKYLVANKKQLSSWNISFFDLNDLSLLPILASPWHEYKIKVSGDELCYTALYGGKVNSYKLDLNSGRAWSLSKSSYADDGVVLNGNLYSIGIADEGTYVYGSEPTLLSYDLPGPELIKEQDSWPEVEIKEGSALLSNFSYLLWPTQRVWPSPFAGEDAIGYNSYLADYSSNGGINFYFDSSLLLPLTLSYANMSQGTVNYLAASYPLYRSSRKGLSAVSLSLSTYFLGVVYPGISLRFSAPKYNATFSWQLDPEANGTNLVLSQNYLFNSGMLNLYANLFKDFGKGFYPRGFPRWGGTGSGYQFNVNLTQQVMRIRRGLWNPNFFIGDVYGTLFFEHAYLNTSLSSYGYELTFEGGGAYWESFVPKLGLAFANGESRGYFGLNFS